MANQTPSDINSKTTPPDAVGPIPSGSGEPPIPPAVTTAPGRPRKRRHRWLKVMVAFLAVLDDVKSAQTAGYALISIWMLALAPN